MEICLAWFKPVYFLYIYGFLINFKPYEPYHYEILSSTNLTDAEISQKVLSVSVYSQFLTASFLFITIAFCCYNYFFLAFSLSGLAVAVIYSFGNSDIILYQIAEGLRGISTVLEFIYYPSVYLFNDSKEKIPKLTAYIWIAALLGKSISFLLGQVFLTQSWMSIVQITFLTIPASCHAIFLISYLPLLKEEENVPKKIIEKFVFFKKKVCEAVFHKHLVKWSFWTGLSFAAYWELVGHVEKIWRNHQQKYDLEVYNGMFMGMALCLSVFSVYFLKYLKFNWQYDNALLGITSLLQAVLIIVMQASDAGCSWIMFVIYVILFHTTLVALMMEISKECYEKKYLGLVFGSIALVASFGQLIFNIVFMVVEIQRPNTKLVFYSSYHLLISILLSVTWLLW